MKRKILTVLVIFLTMFSCTCLLSACGNKHTHSWTNYEMLDDLSHKCICECGNSEFQEHDFNLDNICNYCAYDAGTLGLIYTKKFSNNEEYYVLSEIGSPATTYIKIPAYVQGIKVKEIGKNVFANSNITGVKVPDTITNICENAFRNCYNLYSITIGKNVGNIDSNAFYGCTNLHSVYYNGNLESWCNIDFNGSAATPFCFAKNFYINNKLIDSINIPNSVNEIKDYAFYKMGNIKNVNIPNTVTRVGKLSFYGCASITNLTLGNSINMIDERAFAFCQGLTKVEIPDSIETLGEQSFYYCSNLYEVIIGSSLKHLNESVFSNCDKLIEIFNKSTVIITGYKNIYTPSTGIKRISYIDNFIFYVDTNDTYLVGCTDFPSILTLPESYNGQSYKIYKSAFSDRDELTQIHIGDGVTEISEEAFAYCHFINDVYIGKNVAKIGRYAFFAAKRVHYAGTVINWCNIEMEFNFSYTINNSTGYLLYIDDELVSDLVIPNGVTKLGEHSFGYCNSITSLTLPDTITSIEMGALWDCMNLTTINYLGTLEQWQQVYWHPNSKGNTKILTIHCSDGDYL